MGRLQSRSVIQEAMSSGNSVAAVNRILSEQEAGEDDIEIGEPIDGPEADEIEGDGGDLESMGERDFQDLVRQILTDAFSGGEFGEKPISVSTLKEVRDGGSEVPMYGSQAGLVIAQGPIEFYVSITKGVRKS